MHKELILRVPEHDDVRSVESRRQRLVGDLCDGRKFTEEDRKEAGGDIVRYFDAARHLIKKKRSCTWRSTQRGRCASGMASKM